MLFRSDSLFDPAILRRYRFMVMLDVRRGHETLNWIENERAAWYVPCHAPASQDVRELVRQNREALTWLTESVWTAISVPGSREDVLARIGGNAALGLEMDAAHLLLNLCSVGAHLTALAEASRAKPYVLHSEGADPSAVLFDAIQAAKSKGTDVLIVDTAGRLQNKKNLMDELGKMNRIIDREFPEASRETLLVLDAISNIF